MMTLKEFLHDQADRVRSHEAARGAKLKDWTESIERLIGQMTQWLRDSDPEDLLKLHEDRVRMSEPSLGTYSAPVLRIGLGGREVQVSPVAYEVIGPGLRRADGTELRGRVDLLGGPFTYMLYRQVDGSGQEGWLLLDDRTFQSRPLTREAFEAAILSLLG